MLGLTIAAMGSEAAVIGLDADGVRLGAPDGSWRPVAAPRMGLVGPEGDLLDGLYAMATVPAGGHGAWVLPGVPTADAQRLRAAGTIRVAGPVPPATVAFTVTAEL